MKVKIIILAVVVIAIGSLFYGRARAIDAYSEATAVARAKGDTAGAVKSFQRVVLLKNLVPLNPRRPQAYARLGGLYFNNGNVNEALDSFKAALQLDKKNPDAHLGVGLIRLQEGDYRQAIKEFDAVIEVQPKRVEAYLARQVAYRKLGDKDKAVSDLKRVLEIDEKNETAKQALKALE